MFDQEWVEAAKRREDDMRRHVSPTPAHAPAPWRTWTPPAPARPPVRRQVPRWSPTASILIGVTTVLGMLLALVMCGFAAGALRTTSRDDRTAAPPAFVPSPAAAPASAAPPPASVPASVPASALPRKLPWTASTTLPAGENAYQPEVFARLVVGSCLAETHDLHSAALVPCSGPHTDEVTRVDSLTTQFSTLPTLDQVDALNDQRCPPAANAWLGGADPQYTSGYLWWFENGDPGEVVRSFVCTVTRTGHQPFTGTLRHAVA